MNAFAGYAGRMVAVSSGDVYLAYARFIRFESGSLVPNPLTEDSQLRTRLYPYRAQAMSAEDPQFAYDKIPVEAVVLSTAELPGTVLRLPKVYGPDQNADFATVYRYRNHPNWRWTHGYVENLAAAVALAAVHPNAANRTFNVGEAETPTVGERLRSLPCSCIPTDQLNTYDFNQHLVYATDQIREDLGYREIVSYEDGIRRTLGASV